MQAKHPLQRLLGKTPSRTIAAACWPGRPRPPPTLYQCFAGGEFQNAKKGRGYFVGDGQMVEWALAEKLTVFFDGPVDRAHIRPLAEGLVPREPRWFTSGDEIKSMLRRAAGLLRERARLLSE